MTDDDYTEWTPPKGARIGEATKQARQQRDTDEEPAPEWWSDVWEMRMHYGVGSFERERFDYEIIPDTWIHEKPAETTRSSGGTDALQVGERGCGKSNLNLFRALRLLEINGDDGERVVWRASPSRSEWLPFRHWATVWLPARPNTEAAWIDERMDRDVGSVDLEDEVRRVVEYDNARDLVERLEDEPGGSFHVVYPDPSFTGCEELTRDSHRVGKDLPFVPRWVDEDGGGTPLPHWWYAFFLALTDERPSSSWISVIFDEAHELAPAEAEDDDHMTWSKVALLSDLYADWRRRRISPFWSAHREKKLHDKLRSEVMRRVDMPDKSPNPRTKLRSSIPVGYSTVPMHSDIMSYRDVGIALLFDETEFDLFSWSHIREEGVQERRIEISLGPPVEQLEEQQSEVTA